MYYLSRHRRLLIETISSMIYSTPNPPNKWLIEKKNRNEKRKWGGE